MPKPLRHTRGQLNSSPQRLNTTSSGAFALHDSSHSRSTAYQRSGNVEAALKVQGNGTKVADSQDAEQAVLLAQQRGKAELIASAQVRRGYALSDSSFDMQDLVEWVEEVYRQQRSLRCSEKCRIQGQNHGYMDFKEQSCIEAMYPDQAEHGANYSVRRRADNLER